MSNTKEKRLARARQKRTGERYTTALMHVRREAAEAKANAAEAALAAAERGDSPTA